MVPKNGKISIRSNPKLGGFVKSFLLIGFEHFTEGNAM